MAKLSTFTRNSAAVSEGSPIVVGPEGNTFTLVTRGYTNDYADRLWELRRSAAIRLNSNISPNQTPVSPDFLPPSEEDACVAQAIAEKCLLDVRDLTNPDGSPVTLADYCGLMKDRANRPLLALAMQAAGAVGRATKDQLEAAEKKLTEALVWLIEDAPIVSRYGDGAIPKWDWEAQDALSRRVLVNEAWQTQWRCWHELAGARHYTFEVYGGGLGAIRGVSKPLPLSVLDIIAWCDAYGLSDDARCFTLNLVKAMDRVFVEIRSAQIKADLEQAFRK